MKKLLLVTLLFLPILSGCHDDNSEYPGAPTDVITGTSWTDNGIINPSNPGNTTTTPEPNTIFLMSMGLLLILYAIQDKKTKKSV